jgi:DNA repair photolyase
MPPYPSPASGAGPPSRRPIPGRGATFNPPNRFERIQLEPAPDDAVAEGEEPAAPRPTTQFYVDGTESVLVRNDSPDVNFTWGLNPYRGCEHGCAYCYARPYHEFLGWSSGLDFETRIMVKLRAPALLRAELAAPRWRPETIGMSGVTDCYQPAERRFRLTRGCLEVLAAFRQPVSIVTKNFLVTRDCDLLKELARFEAVQVSLSVTTLDPALAAKLEPRAAAPARRLQAVGLLASAGVPVNVLVAPVIPGLTDHEIPAILAAAAGQGARTAAYEILRLPHAVKDVFLAWLDAHEPAKKERVLARLRALKGGRLNVSEFGARMRGTGVFARQIDDLFHAAARRAGLNRQEITLSAAHFRRPGGAQLELF